MLRLLLLLLRRWRWWRRLPLTARLLLKLLLLPVVLVRAALVLIEAMRAGALDSPLYTNAALKARELLFYAPEVVSALHYAWRAFSFLRRAQGTSVDGIGRKGYLTMMRKIYLSLKADADNLDPDDCLASAQKDWKDDSKDQDALYEDDFKRCWFQLVDVYTDSIEPAT